MNYVRMTVLLAFVSFINLVLALSMHVVVNTVFTQLKSASTQMGVYGKVASLLGNLEIIFWLLFILSAVGAIVWYMLGAHREEYETYQEYRRF